MLAGMHTDGGYLIASEGSEEARHANVDATLGLSREFVDDGVGLWWSQVTEVGGVLTPAR